MSDPEKLIQNTAAAYRAANISGARYGRLVVVSKAAGMRGRHTAWLCQCDCGGQVVVSRHSLTTGNTQSCGCYSRDVAAQRFRKHGGYGSGEYRCWSSIKRRCFNAAAREYPSYGGRGITMCREWKEDFSAFLRDMGPRPSLGHSVDRINNDGNYEPGNCRWATQTEQNLNQNRTVLVDVGGEIATAHELALAVGLPPDLVKRRLRRGMSLERALCTDRYGARNPSASNADELARRRQAHALAQQTRRSAAH